MKGRRRHPGPIERAPLVARALASAFLASDWTARGMLDRSQEVHPRTRTRVRPLVRRVLRTYASPPRDRIDELAALLERPWSELPRTRAGRPPVPRWIVTPTEMVVRRWDVPEIATVGDLARVLAVTIGELDWLADRRGWLRRERDPRLVHYRARWVPKRSGGARLLEAPKPRLAAIQRTILHAILDRVPGHDASHGFRRGRSVHGFVAPHAGRGVVIRIDLEDFFASVDAGRVLGIFRTAGYPDEVARTLTALACTRAHRSMLRGVPPGVSDVDALARTRARLRALHLPTGAPTSPALATLAAFRLDVRLAGLADRIDARYTRYADDLAFSLEHASRERVDRLVATVSEIAAEEGFTVAARKTRIMRRGARQELGGVSIAGDRPRVPRREHDRLRAILHLAARTGPEAQNRAGHPDFRAHLLGRIAWIASWSPARGEALRKLFDAIDWG